jgi:hypothetical protein
VYDYPMTRPIVDLDSAMTQPARWP